MAKFKLFHIKRYVVVFFIIFIAAFLYLMKLQYNTSPKESVVFWTLQLGTFDKYINNIIEEFEKENDYKVKIKWVDIPYSEGEKRTLAAILTDNPPDLVNLTPDFSLLLAQKNALYSIDKESLNSYIPSLSETLKYNNKYFGIPFYATSAVTLYNKNLLKKENIKQVPVSYDELFNIPFKTDNGIYLTMINFSENDTLLKLLNKYGINSPETITSSKSIEIFRTFKNLYTKSIIPKECVTQTHRDALEKYMSGQIAFLVTGANFINMIKENAPDIYASTGVSPQLTADSGLYDYSLMNFVIPAKSKNPEYALKFALFFTNKQNQLELAKMTTILPVNKEALNDDYFKTDIDSDITSKARIISSSQLNKLQPPLKNVKNKKELNTLSSNYIQDILINNADINECLEKFASDWAKL